MATLYIGQYFEIAIDGKNVTGGSRSGFDEVSVSGYIKDANKILATATTWDFWLAGSDESITATTGWALFYMVADQDVFVELVCNDGGGTQEDFAFKVYANTPFMMRGDDAKAAHTEDFAGSETNDVIDAIRIRNESGSNAVIRAVLVA